MAEWIELEMANMEEQISQSEAGSDEHEAGLRAYERLETIRLNRERLKIDQEREKIKSEASVKQAKGEVVRTCIGSVTLFAGIILVAAIERETPFTQKLFSMVTKVIPKVV